MNTAAKLALPDRAPLLAVSAQYTFKDSIKAQGGRWDPERRVWLLPYTPEAWQSLCMTVHVTPDQSILEELSAPAETPQGPAPEAPPMPLKPGIVPFKHQAEAYAHALKTYGVIKEECQYED